jgi:hypothetical protein
MVTRFSQLEPPVWLWLQKTEPKLHLILDLFSEPELEPVLESEPEFWKIIYFYRKNEKDWNPELIGD